VTLFVAYVLVLVVVNTARDDMNGQLGIVVQFQQERGRYLVHMTQSQTTVAMKPENLQKGGYMDQAKAYYQQVSRDPQIQQILNRLAAYLPPGVPPKYAAIGAGLAVVMFVYFVGFSRTMMMLSFAMMILMVIGQDLLAGANSNTIIRNAPSRFRDLVREQCPGGNYLVGKSYEHYVHMALAAFILVFFVKSMMPVSKSTASTNTATMPSRNLMTNTKMAEEYYKLGFEDATAQKLYGASLPADLSANDPTTTSNYDPMDDFPDYRMPPSTGGMMGKLFSFSSAMSVLYLGRTAMELGKDANGSWSFLLFRQNLVTLEPWKLGLLGLSLYRLVAAVTGK
jgi:hypothetical protein